MSDYLEQFRKELEEKEMNQTNKDQINVLLINAASQLASAQGLIEQAHNLFRIEESKEDESKK